MSNSQHISERIEERMTQFTIDVITMTKTLPKTIENEIMSKQMIRSSSSIGANYIEANNASSRLDFRNKIFTSKKEAAETRYWLKIVKSTNENADVIALLDECSQFLFMLQSIVSSLKNSKLRV